MAINIRKFFEGIGLVPKASLSLDSKGELQVLDSNGKLNYHNGTTASPIVTEAHTATLTNKTIVDPLGLDRDDVGLSNVDNTSDLNKPVSTATQTALDGKANTNLNNLTGPTSLSQSLLPATASSVDLGSNSLPWSLGVIDNIRTLDFGLYDTDYPSVLAQLTRINANNISLRSNQNVNLRIESQSTSSVNSGSLDLITGNSTSLNSGSVNITTGTAGGTRGQITLDGSQVDVSNTKIVNLADPTAIQDAANKNYVDSSISSNAANLTLSNLSSPTAINQNLNPDTNNTRAIGSSSNYWLNSFLDSVFTRFITAAPSSPLLIRTQLETSLPSQAVLVSTGNSNTQPTGGISLTTGTSNTSSSGDITLTTGSGTIRGRVAIQARALRLPTSSSAPASPSAGDMYFNTTDNKSYTYDGTTWQAHY